MMSVLNQQVVLGVLLVHWSDGTTTSYDAVDMGVQWFKMSNDGLYEKCRNIVYPQS